MTQIRVEVEQVLRYIGMNGTKKGFWCFYWGVVLALEDPSLLVAVTKRLYPAVAEACGMNPVNVQRDMRTIVEWCWQYGDREALCDVAGRKLIDKPTVGELLDYVASYLRKIGYF